MNQIVQKLCSGTWSRAYRQMGAHPGRSGGRDGWRFRVWAPNASDVSLAGDFSGWQPLPMVRKDGLWECFVPGAKEFDSYKYVVTGADGHTRWKADPYAVHSQTRPETASKLFDLSRFRWQTKRRNLPRGPMNIYEVHLGSWRRGGGRAVPVVPGTGRAAAGLCARHGLHLRGAAAGDGVPAR